MSYCPEVCQDPSLRKKMVSQTPVRTNCHILAMELGLKLRLRSAVLEVSGQEKQERKTKSKPIIKKEWKNCFEETAYNAAKQKYLEYYSH